MKILAIDTSCDETSVAISEDNSLLSNVLSSSMKFHNDWGGVVPIIAKRNHIERIDKVLKRALNLAQVELENIDVFAVTIGPGLAPALEIGIQKIRDLATEFGKPVIGVNHMVGHIYSNFVSHLKSGSGSLRNKKTPQSPLDKGVKFPLLALLISGGHTEIIYMTDHLEFEKIGKTRDDSIGEAFDKVARMLQWGYPGGPIIEKYAKEGDEDSFDFPVAMKGSGDLDFSYSGLKTAVLQTVKQLGTKGESEFEKMSSDLKEKQKEYESELYQPSLSKKPTFNLSKKDSLDIAASFQKAAAEQLIMKMKKAVEKYPVKDVLLGGGVVSNIYIRNKLRKILKEKHNVVKLHFPKSKKLLTDNAGMIAIAAYYMAQKNMFTDIKELDRIPRLSI